MQLRRVYYTILVKSTFYKYMKMEWKMGAAMIYLGTRLENMLCCLFYIKGLKDKDFNSISDCDRQLLKRMQLFVNRYQILFLWFLYHD